jgi:2-keto-4-pentenoate hydratase/2-oxohepta-3-ene-1,7-dioic acid hydratase in catechol pathway
MKLFTFASSHGARPGIALDADTGLDLLAAAPDMPHSWPELFTRLNRVRELEAEYAVSTGNQPLSPPLFSLSEVTFLPPITEPSKIIAIGRNYRDHAEEQQAKLPPAPLLFSKAPSCLLGHNGAIELTSDLDQVDAEAELAVIISKTAKAVPRETAHEYIAGYTCFNDISDRAAQFADKQWFRGKSIDTGGPCGPWIVTPDELPALASGLDIICRWNDRVMQQSNTRLLIFPVDELISYASRHMTLLPGDIIATGTPAGVGVFRDPPVFLRPGDQVEVEIAGIGKLRNSVIAA